MQGAFPADGGRPLDSAPIQQVFALNMAIYRRKYAMNLLMNLMHHLAVAVTLCIGGWFAVEGRIEVEPSWRLWAASAS